MKEAFLKIKENHKIKVDLDVIAKEIKIDDQNDFIELDVEENDALFECLTLIKGEIYPLPRINDIIKVTEIYFEFDKLLNFKVLAKGEIKQKLKENIQAKIYHEIYSFSKDKMLESLKKIYNIKEKIFTGIFRIVDLNFQKEDYSNLLCLEDMKSYKINAVNLPFSLETNKFILISNYSLDEKSGFIIFNKITLVKELTEENLFFYIDSYYRNNKKLLLFKVIDINENYYMLINRYKEIYKLNRTKEVENSGINLCCLLLITNNFKAISYSNTQIKDMIFDDTEIIYASKQEIYFSKIIQINYISVIQINFLDYNNSENFFELIEIQKKQIKIDNNELFYPFYENTENEIFSEEIELKILETDKIKSSFNCFIYRGLLNKINAFINYYSNNAFFYEYYFMCIDEPIKNIDTHVNIGINGKKYEPKIYDTFQSLNRKRINVLNIPYQEIENFDSKELKEKNLNSIQICKIYQNKKSMIFGIFDIKENLFITQKSDNSKFDPYYEDFGDIISIIGSKNDYDNNIIEICKKKYINSKIEKSEDFILSTYNDEITLSQFKTRVGLVLSHYIYKCNEENDIKDILLYYQYIRWKIPSKKITLLQQLRIIILFLRKKIEDPSSLNELIYFPECPKNSPYVLAKKLNEEEINNLDEFSRSFAAYLQIDSYIMYNYLKKENSYTFSLELLFIMKYLLLSNYEDFIFTSRQQSDEYAYNTHNENITVLNEANLFSINCNKLKKINDINESKNYAIPISFEFRHENNSHQKKNRKNRNSLSPFLFYRDGKFVKIQVYRKLEDNTIIEKGESGRMVESFICEEKSVINDFKKLHIFGELYNFKYFIKKDFSELITNMKRIKLKNTGKNRDQKQSNCESFDKIDNSNEEKEKIISELWEKKLEQEGTIRIGDIHYTKFEIKKLLENAKKHN